MGIIKLGLVTFGAFAIGGRLGLTVYSSLGGAVTTDSSGKFTDASQGAIWGGRVVTFLGLAYLASKV